MAISAGRSSDLFIDGQLVPGGAGHYPNINPATEEVLGTAANADPPGRWTAPRPPPCPTDCCPLACWTRRGYKHLQPTADSRLSKVRDFGPAVPRHTRLGFKRSHTPAGRPCCNPG
jgi:hypothetical protein